MSFRLLSSMTNYLLLFCFKCIQGIIESCMTHSSFAWKHIKCVWKGTEMWYTSEEKQLKQGYNRLFQRGNVKLCYCLSLCTYVLRLFTKLMLMNRQTDVTLWRKRNGLACKKKKKDSSEAFHIYSKHVKDQLKHLSTRLSIIIKHCPELKGWTWVLQERNETWQGHSGLHNRFSSHSLSWLIMSGKKGLAKMDRFFSQFKRQSSFPIVSLLQAAAQ